MNGNRRPTMQRPRSDSANGSSLRLDSNGLVRVVTMIFSGIFISLAFLGAGLVVLSVFDTGLDKANPVHVFIQIILLAFLGLLGIGMAMVGSRLGNLMIPMVFDFYKFFLAIAISILYYLIIQKMAGFDFSLLKYIVYLAILISGLFTLFLLTPLSESKNLMGPGVVIFAMVLVQVFVVVVKYFWIIRYVNVPNIQDFFFADFLMILLIAGIVVLMMRKPLLISVTRGASRRNVWRGNQPPPQGG